MIVSIMKRFKNFIVVLILLKACAAKECKDYNSLCPNYARFGFCKADQVNMAKTCPKSCGFCDDSGTRTTKNPPTVNPKATTSFPPQSTSAQKTFHPTHSTRRPHTVLPPRTTTPPQGKCGLPVNPSSRIISGSKATKDAWPWQASIYYNGQFLCGGSVISPTWILTAAHCVDGFDYQYYQIVLGDYDRSYKDGDEQIYRAQDAFHHPNWMSPTQLNNDVALIQLDRPALFDTHVQPICLPDSGVDFPVGKQCYITGWGQHSLGRAGPPTEILKQSPLNIVSQQACYYLNTNNLGIPVTNKMVCGGFGPNYPNTGCHGDSGGPYVCQEDDGRWVLQGSVSWGSGTCDSSEAYSVFARISQFRSWVDNYVNDM